MKRGILLVSVSTNATCKTFVYVLWGHERSFPNVINNVSNASMQLKQLIAVEGERELGLVMVLFFSFITIYLFSYLSSLSYWQASTATDGSLLPQN